MCVFADLEISATEVSADEGVGWGGSFAMDMCLMRGVFCVCGAVPAVVSVSVPVAVPVAVPVGAVGGDVVACVGHGAAASAVAS